jgi:CHAT domain-containing protein
MRAVLFTGLFSMLLAQEPVPSQASALIAEGEKLARANQREQALPKFVAALEAARASGDRKPEALALTRLGQTHLQLDNYAEGLKHIEQSLPVWQTLGDRFQLALAIHNYAAALWSLGDSPAALARYEEALAIRKEIADRRGEAYTLRGIANCYWSMGEPAAALERSRQALEIRKEQKDLPGEADSRNALGLLYALLGDAARARAEFQQSYALAQRSGDAMQALMAQANLGWAAVGLGQYQASLRDLEPALAAFEQARNRYAEAYVSHNLGNANAGLGNAAKARRYYERSLELKRELGDRWGEAYTLHALGESAGSLPMLEQALAARRALRDRTGLILTLGSMARLHRESGDFAKAEAEIREAVELIESSRVRLASQDLRASFLASKRDFYEFQIDLLASANRVTEAFEAAEQSRGRLLLDRLGDVLAEVRTHAPADLQARQKAAQRRVNALADRLERLAAGPRKGAQEAALQRELDGALAEARDAAEAVRRASSRQFSELTDPPRLPAAEIRKLLRPGEILLTYSLGRDRSYLWIATAQSLTIRKLAANRARFEAEVQKLSRAIANRDPQWQAAALAVDRMLGVPAGLGRLVIAADGVLETLPFAVLPSCQRREIAYLPSASALALRRGQQESKPAARERILALADPVLDRRDPRLPAGVAGQASSNSLPRLRFSRLEAELLARLRPGAALTALDASASKALLTKQADSLRNLTILHLASHAIVDAARPELSQVILSAFDSRAIPVEDSSLRLHEIYQLDLRSARLVTLSACRSAAGSPLPGEGLVSLTRGFQYAGAGSVLATLWDVDDRSTASWMEEFYGALLERKQSLAGAVEWANRAIRERRAEWAHPYYWAGFVLQGEWR